MSPKSSTVNVAIIGWGMSARVFHAPLITSNPSFRLTTVLERHSNHSKEAYPDVTVVKSAEELWAAEEVKLVVITTPNDSHYPLVTAALRAGKHVVVEKPFTVTSEQADTLTALAISLGLTITVYHNRRWDGDFLTVQKLIHDNTLGRIVELESHFDRYRPAPKPGNPWRESAATPGSGILYDLGSHLIDQATTLFGEASSISADVRNQRQFEGVDVDDSFDIRLTYPSGLRVILRAGMLVKDLGPRFIVHGTEGSFVKYGLDPQEAQLKAGLTPASPDYGIEPASAHGTLTTDLNGLDISAKVTTLPGRYPHFYESVHATITGEDTDRTADHVLAAQAARVIHYIEAARRSSEEGKVISLEQ